MNRADLKERFHLERAFEHQTDSYRSRVHRPSFTPLCICALVFWASCAFCYSLGCALELELLRLISVVTLVGSGAFALVACRTKRVQMLLFIASALLLGAALASAQAYSMRTSAELFDSYASVHATLTLLEDSSRGSYYESAKASITLDDGQVVIVQARFPNDLKGLSVLYTQDDETTKALLYGQSFDVRGTLSSIDYSANSYAWQNAYVASFRVDTAEPLAGNVIMRALINVRKSVLDFYASGNDESVLLQAITCGYRHELKSSALYNTYQSCGLAHLVAVSGAHLVIVTGLFAELFRKLKLPRRLIVFLLVGIMLSYLAMSGAPISALRATIMSSVGILALIGKRRPSSQNALGISIFFIIVSDPASSISLSLALSALSTLGIVLFAPLFSRLLQQTPLARFSL